MTIDEDFLSSHWMVVHYVDLPISCRAFIVYRDDEYVIVINNRLSDDAKRKALEHEVNHVLSGEMDDLLYFEYNQEF